MSDTDHNVVFERELQSVDHYYYYYHNYYRNACMHLFRMRARRATVD